MIKAMKMNLKQIFLSGLFFGQLFAAPYKNKIERPKVYKSSCCSKLEKTYSFNKKNIDSKGDLSDPIFTQKEIDSVITILVTCCALLNQSRQNNPGNFLMKKSN